MKVLFLIGLFCLLNLFSYGQRIPHKYDKYFECFCNSKPLKIDLPLNTHGYFNLPWIDLSRPNDTNYSPILFYENGICVRDWGINAPDKQNYINSVILNGPKDYYYINSGWGCYNIIKDTIIVRSIIPGTFMRPISVWETKYLIINRTTIKQIFFSALDEKRKGKVNHTDSNFIDLVSKFYYLKEIPPFSYAWFYK